MITFSDETKDIQDRFGCGKLAERMVQHVFYKEFTAEDRAFISNAMFFFLATVDAKGQPQSSYKGGGKGFVKITGPSELVFPFYEGNGMYLSAGNIAAMGKVGLLFVDFESQTRIRVNGVASIDDDHPMNGDVEAAQLVVRVSVSDIHPELVREAAREFPGKVAVGIDARNGRVATKGWATETDILVTDLARSFEDAGVAAIIYTDINRDGAMQGPNIQATADLARAVSIPVIASGGVSSLADLIALRDCGVSLNGAISGRALYDGAIDLAEALIAIKGDKA